jgi:hypothetical protein
LLDFAARCGGRSGEGRPTWACKPAFAGLHGHNVAAAKRASGAAGRGQTGSAGSGRG